MKFTQWTQTSDCARPVYLGLREDVNPDDYVAKALQARDQAARRRTLLAGREQKRRFATVDGQALKFTNLEQGLLPRRRLHQTRCLNYYDAVSGLILPHLKDRPLSLKRYPNGIKEQFFFQKHVADNFRLLAAHGEIDSDHNEAPIKLCLRAGPRQPALSRQPRLHRSESVDEPLAARSTIPILF